MDTPLLIGGLLAVAAVLSTRFARRFGVPALVIFVVSGMLAGTDGPGGVEFSDYDLSYTIGLIALAVILFSGGLDTNARLFRRSLVPGALLATVGVVAKMLLIGLVVALISPLDLQMSLLVGAILAPTDAAAVFSVLAGQGLPERLRGVLETESGTNDPVSIYLTMALATAAAGGEVSGFGMVLGVIVQLGLGAVCGLGAGWVLARLVDRVRVDSAGLYPVLALAGGLSIYAATNLVGGNGFLAIYLAGMVVGNRPVSHRSDIRRFMEGFAWLGQIAMFTLLGLVVDPSLLVSHLPVGLAVALALILIARPASVFLVLEPLSRWGRHRFDTAEQLLVSWAGLKGAVPIILAMVPLQLGVPGAEAVFGIVFVVVIFGATVQGLTIIPLARWLRLLEPTPPEPPIGVEFTGAAPVGSGAFDVYLAAEHPLVGRRLAEIDLPPALVIAAIHREGRLVTPRGEVVLAAGDHVFVLSNDVSSGLPAALSGRRAPADLPPATPEAGAESIAP